MNKKGLKSIEGKEYRIRITDSTIAQQFHQVHFLGATEDNETIKAINTVTKEKFKAVRGKDGVYDVMYDYEDYNCKQQSGYIVVDLEKDPNITQIRLRDQNEEK